MVVKTTLLAAFTLPILAPRVTASIMLSEGEDILWVSRIMLGHSEVATTYKFYAKYIKSKDKKHASFLDDTSTSSVQNINLKCESA